jgi:protein-L-isoaspartate(D-aspartate) O-methyltransferase
MRSLLRPGAVHSGTLIRQLSIGGRMVIPVGNQFSQDLIQVYKDDQGVRTTNLGGCRFVKLVGEHGWRT